MTYYIIQDGKVYEELENEDMALYSARELRKTNGKDVEIVLVIATIFGGKQ